MKKRTRYQAAVPAWVLIAAMGMSPVFSAVGITGNGVGMEVSWFQEQGVSMPVRMWGRMGFWQAVCWGIVTAVATEKENGKRKAAEVRSGRIW